MSNYDVAVGLDEATLNKALAQLFTHAGFQQTVARGNKKVATPIGEIDITWEILEPPTLSFEKVPDDHWQAATKGLHNKKLPDDNVVTLVLPRLYAELEYADGVRESDTTEAHLFAQLRVADGKVTVDPYGVWVDKAQLQSIQISALEALAFFGLEMAEDALTDLALPAVPASLGVELGPPSAVIDGRRLVVAMALKPQAVDLSGVTWPDAGLFVLGSHALANGLVRGQLHRIRGQTLTWRKSALGAPGDGGAAVVEAVCQVLEADVQVDARELTQIGGSLQVSVRAAAVVSLLKAVGLSAVVKILEKLYLAWQGLGYGAQILPAPIQARVGLGLQDRTVKVQLQWVRRCVALIWPRGSLPTILLSLALWPLTQLVAIIGVLVALRKANGGQFQWDAFTIPPVSFDLLGKPLTVQAGGLSCATHEGQLLIRGAIDLQ